MPTMNVNALYPILIEALTEEDGGGYVASSPDLPGCMTDGETQEEALSNMHDAIDSWLEASAIEVLGIPKPSMHVSSVKYSGKFTTRVHPTLHKEVTDYSKHIGVSVNQVINNALLLLLRCDLTSLPPHTNWDFNRTQVFEGGRQ